MNAHVYTPTSSRIGTAPIGAINSGLSLYEYLINRFNYPSLRNNVYFYFILLTLTNYIPLCNTMEPTESSIGPRVSSRHEEDYPKMALESVSSRTQPQLLSGQQASDLFQIQMVSPMVLKQVRDGEVHRSVTCGPSRGSEVNTTILKI